MKLIPSIRIQSKANIIITPKIRHYVGRAYQFGQVLAGHPYIWNRRTNQLEHGSRWRQRIWWGNMALALSYSVFVYVRCGQISLDGSRSKNEKIYMRVMAAYMTLAILLHVTMIRAKDTIVPYSNYVFQFAELFEERYLKENSKVPITQILMGIFLQGTYLGINSMTVMMTINAALRPMSPEQPASVLGQSLAARVISVAIIGQVEYVYHASSYILIMSCYSSMAMALTIISELGSKTSRITLDTLRAANTKLRLYKQLRVLLIIFNEMYNSFLIPSVKFIGIAIVTFGVYSGVRMKGIQSYAFGFLGSFMAVILLLMFGFLAEFHYRGSKLLREWSDQQLGSQSLLFAKELKALSPLKAVMMSHYFVDRPMVFTLADVLMTSTVNFLLLNRKQSS